jgi:DegV family protein with EDD domain
MPAVAIVTDSTANINPELIGNLPIFVVPLQLIWGNESLRDGVDIQPSEFYDRLKTSKVMPSTSQPSPAAFKEVYERLLNQGYEILSIQISKKLSGTMDSATQARDMFPGRPIELVDSDSTSMALGLQVLKTAQAAANGASLQECKQIAVHSIPRIGALFAVSTLEYLYRGGRIGGAAAFLGTTLGLKPILELRSGRIEAIERVRTMSKALDRLLELLEQRVAGQPVRLSGLHAASAEQAQMLLEKTVQRFGVDQVKSQAMVEVSPVIGTHAGPGTVGMAWLLEN